MNGATNNTQPRAWIGCLGCYNGGNLVGEWFDAIDAPQDMDDFNGRGWKTPNPALAPHIAEGHEELWVMDFEGFHGLLSGECSPMEAKRLAGLLAQADERGLPAEAVAYWAGDGYDTSDADAFLDGLADVYCGLYDSEADYAQELAEEIGEASDVTARWPFTCIDWQAAWRELNFGGDNYAVAAPDGGVFVFRAI